MGGYRLIITPVAGREIEEIYDWIAKDSATNAADMISKILRAMDRLKQFPHRTVAEFPSSGLRYPARSLPVKPYIVWFRVLDDEKVVRVRHGARARAGSIRIAGAKALGQH